MPQIKDAGTYTGRVLKSEFGESKDSVPFFALELESEQQETIHAFLFLTDAALPYTKEKLEKAFDFDGRFETASSQVDGKPCRFVVVINEYKGKERPEVKAIYNINSGFDIRPLQGGSDFLRKLSDKAKRLPVPPPRATPAAPKKADVPF